MDRFEFAKGKVNKSGIAYSTFTNNFTAQYVAITDVNGDKICDYLRMLRIEKTRRYYDPPEADYIEWTEGNFPSCRCTNCFSFDEFPEGLNIIKVDNSKDMLPLYMKWALKLGGTFDDEGYITNEAFGVDGLKLHETLSKLYENINGRHRLKKFREYRCEKCKKEWIIFDDKDKVEEK